VTATVHIATIVGHAEVKETPIDGTPYGDTLTLLVDGQQIKVRLEGIDAPEKGQPFGDRARQELGRLVFGKKVKVETTGKDRYGHTLGRVFVGDTNVNRWLPSRQRSYSRPASERGTAGMDWAPSSGRVNMTARRPRESSPHRRPATGHRKETAL
jgi:hypothetical protein